ncbi:hypothetical protein PGT21_025020 [Puccinia graminis f. sp. tritici]|uniref:Uncharacterized protein n=1 Tax=Puccinia graminis f. sp. tritici TaxID=56615 RepID=A0A5B0LMP0_PUCGR|nr:hypothetical protein PGT21_025020 [Puccinia graminis f. sp. tritici]KAA1072680.1 hypothetical protein PGTUg99_017112 [Puccinia graminis f. sp. tritici]
MNEGMILKRFKPSTNLLDVTGLYGSNYAGDQAIETEILDPDNELHTHGNMEF